MTPEQRQSLICVSNVEQMMAGLKDNKPAVIEEARALLHTLIDQSDGGQLVVLMMPVKVLFQREANRLMGGDESTEV